MTVSLFSNFELYYILFLQIVGNKFIYTYIYLYLFFNLWRKGRNRYNYINLHNNKLIEEQSNYFLIVWRIILNGMESIFFYIIAYSPFLTLFRWNYYYSNKLKEKFRYSLRVNHIIYKYDFVFNDEVKDLQLKNIFNQLYKKWLINFTYIITIYAIYLKLMFRLIFFYCLFINYALLYIVKKFIYCNFWLLYIYDIFRYISYKFKIMVLSRITKKLLNKLWVILDYLKLEFVYLVYNVPYFFFLSIIISIINHIYCKLFSFYNRFKFQNKNNDNIIPYTFSLSFFLISFDYILLNNIDNIFNFINIMVKSTRKISFLGIRIKIINNFYSKLNLIYVKLYIWNVTDIIWSFINNCYNIIKQYNFIFLFIGFINLLIMNIIYKLIRSIRNVIYKIIINFIYIFYFICLIIIFYFWFDFYTLIINLKILSIIIKPITLFLNLIHYNIYHNEFWGWFYNINYNDNLLNNNKLILLSFNKFIYSLELQKSNYIMLFIGYMKDLILIFSSFFDVSFTYFLELLYYWYYEFNFNIFTYIKILIYYFFYYFYLYVYLLVTPFIFLNSDQYYYYFWLIYVYIILFYKSILYYIIILYLYVMPYYFTPVLLKIIYYFWGLYFKYNMTFSYFNLLLIELINLVKLTYISIKRIIFINIILFIDIYVNLNVYYNIYLIIFISTLKLFFKIIKLSYNNLFFYLNYIHINFLFELENIIDLICSNNRLSKYNYNKFTISLEDNIYIDKTRILGLKILSPIGGEIRDYYKTFRPIFFFRNDTLSFINNNYFLKSIMQLKKDIHCIDNFLIVNEYFPVLLRYLKYYFLLFYFITYIIFKYVIIKDHKAEFNLPYLWTKLINDNIIKLPKNKKANKITLLKMKYDDLNLHLINLLNNKFNKYIINQNNYKIKLRYIKDYIKEDIKLRYYINIFHSNILIDKYKNYIYILNNNMDKTLKRLQKDYNENIYVYYFCNLQNNIFEEEYYYKSNSLKKIDRKRLEQQHIEVTAWIINYFNFLDKFLFKNIGPNWLLNKSYSTLFFNKSLGTEVILTPYYAAANNGFFFLLFIPLLFYYFIFYVSCNFYNISEIDQYFFYIYFYIFLENIEIIYNFYIGFISSNEFVDYEFNFYSLSKKSMDEEFMFFLSEKIKYYNYLKNYNNLISFKKENYITNSINIIYSNRIYNIYILRYIILLYVVLLYLYKYNKTTYNKIIYKKYYNKFIISILHHYKFIINKKFKLL